jgi:hypothetical protein
LALKEIIEEKQLIDRTNSSIVVFNDELESIFGAKALHFSQVWPKVEEFLKKKNGYEPVTNIDLGNREVQAMNFWMDQRQDPIESSLFNLFAEAARPYPDEIILKDQFVLMLKNQGILNRKAPKRVKFDRFIILAKALISRCPNVGGNNTILDLRHTELGTVIGRNFATRNQIIYDLSTLFTFVDYPRPLRRSNRRF